MLFLYKLQCLTIDKMVLDVELFIATIAFHFLTVEGSSFSPAGLQGKKLIRKKKQLNSYNFVIKIFHEYG